MNQQNLPSFIWSVADLLRGGYKQSEYGKGLVFEELVCKFSKISNETAKRDALTTKAEQVVLLLQERRTAMISATVIC
jgi:type I restriction enzyme M protein